MGLLNQLTDWQGMWQEVMELRDIGTSRGGYPLQVVVIPKASDKDSKKVFINGAHHGDESISALASMELISFLLRMDTLERDSLLEGFQLYIQPIVNPDGLKTGSRFDTMGIDPNRDYPYPERPESEAFKVRSVQAVRDLMKKERFAGALTVHSGMLGVLWPWCYSHKPPPHAKSLKSIARYVAKAMGLTYYSQSNLDYRTTGEFIDYAYMEYSIPALTLEISRQRGGLADPAKAYSRMINGTIAYLEQLRVYDLSSMAH